MIIETGTQLSQTYIIDNRNSIVAINTDEVVLLDKYKGYCRLMYIDLSDYKVKYVVYRSLGEI